MKDFNFSLFRILVFVFFVFGFRNQTNAEVGISQEEEPPQDVKEELRRPVFEFAPAFGYSLGGGAEDPAPNLFLATFSGTIWFSRQFGAGFSVVRSFGRDLYDEVIIDPVEPIGDTYPREYRGKEDLRYYRILFRYRRALGNRTEINLGGGLMLGGRFREIVILHTPDGPVPLSPESQFGGFATEILFGQRIAPHLILKAGAEIDFNFETNILLPMVQMAIDF
jgi:hypothetical protein